MGGYGVTASTAVLKEQQRPDAAAKLIAACDPDLTTNAERADFLRDQGVAVSSSFDELLDSPCHAVWLPLPIHLHRPFTEKALAAGKAVLCEKPAAGCIDDLDAMIAARDRTGLPAAIGFQNIYQPSTHEAKRRLLRGEIGTIKSATVMACWPRDSHYYARNNWAGALKRNGTWVLDSPANNATAHFITLALYLLGQAEALAAIPASVSAELYRANTIENYDTCSMRIITPDGTPLLVLLTHACEQLIGPIVQIHGSKGTLRFENNRFHITTPVGTEQVGEAGLDLRHVVRGFCDYVRGGDSIVATLELARTHALVISGASQATAVCTIPESAVRTVRKADGNTIRALPDIESTFAACIGNQTMLHESGLAGWTRPGGTIHLAGYRHFSGLGEMSRG